MVKDSRYVSDPDSYETWLGSDDAVENLWHTIDGDTFVFTADGIYLPCSIGPIDSETRISPDEFDGYEVEVEHRNNTTPIAVVVGITTAFAIAGLFVSGGLGAVSIAGAILSFLVLSVMGIKERNKVSSLTHITLHMGRHTATVTTEGDKSDILESDLSGLID